MAPKGDDDKRHARELLNNITHIKREIENTENDTLYLERIIRALFKTRENIHNKGSEHHISKRAFVARINDSRILCT